jgi:hypothetical protein
MNRVEVVSAAIPRAAWDIFAGGGIPFGSPGMHGRFFLSEAEGRNVSRTNKSAGRAFRRPAAMQVTVRVVPDPGKVRDEWGGRGLCDEERPDEETS